MKTRKMIWFGCVSVGLVGGMLAGCGPMGWVSADCEETGTTTTATNTGSSETSTATTPLICDECNDYTDCPISQNECRVWTCSFGKCVEEDLTPEHTCEDDDAPCWQGACCFTCVADNGSDLDKMDPHDGPCVSGSEDHLCGFGGGLCQDCTLTDQICVSGHCVKSLP